MCQNMFECMEYAYDEVDVMPYLGSPTNNTNKYTYEMLHWISFGLDVVAAESNTDCVAFLVHQLFNC